jgi:putative heme-binding domain-containing protein
VPSSGIVSSTHFPDDMQGNFIILNAIGFLGIKQYRLDNNGGVVHGTEVEDLLVSSDPNFRPSDFKFGDDGALYVADWSNAIIGHMQHNIRDPARDHQHGRVYRITVEGRPLQESISIDDQPIEALLEVLKHPTDSVRLRARIELSERNTDEVIAATAKWVEQFDVTKPEDAHNLLEALWVHQQHNVVNEALLTAVLHSPEPHARRAAERVKYLWEIEGQLAGNASVPAGVHMHHARHSNDDVIFDYFKQEPSPEPEIVDGTMVIHIQTLKEQMRYDRRSFAVAPGMPVRLVFKNPDAMDHNLVITQPGAKSEVAMAAMMLGPDGIKRNWLPDSRKILFATKMLSMGNTETLEFTAPDEPGAYDYVCTFPGHFMLMNGIMQVVDDPMKWMAENKEVDQGPERRFIRDWTIADLAGELDKLAEGRSIAKGEEVFKAASCNACHAPSATGGRIGPDLAGVADRFQPDAMLTEMLDPSTVINEDYKSWEIHIETEDVFAENTLHGLIVEQTGDALRVVTNPLQDTEGQRIARNQITEMKPAPLSTMPTGLLNSFTKEEILDLMAYLRSVPAPEK